MIDVAVGDAAVDLMGLVQNREIRMLKTARGSAVVYFDSRDWGNFLCHPLVASARLGDDDQFVFRRVGKVDTKGGKATFSGTYKGQQFDLYLSKDGAGELIVGIENDLTSTTKTMTTATASYSTTTSTATAATATATATAKAATTSATVSTIDLCQKLKVWFSNLEINLDGARFRFKNLQFARFDNLVLELDIAVDKFPNPITTTF
ncbi:hypothetical protein GUITHDRAFT_151994, partial [Guillardia theta CCMP2712]|mmetsp:Transcript_43467/g.137446  ORF Transcript_43467/g.137446 Transcript_43467/m.137446 type:complete len:206 (-) Transcript_43467:97-714(-)